jgi:hypothetical protein
VGSLNGEPDAVGMDIIKRDPEFKHRITEMCHNAWERKHARRH